MPEVVTASRRASSTRRRVCDGSRLQLEQDREVVETEAVMPAERLVDIPHDERSRASKVESEVEVRGRGWVGSIR